LYSGERQSGTAHEYRNPRYGLGGSNQEQVQAAGAASAEEALLRLLETQEEQDHWLLANKNAINAKNRRASISLTEARVFPNTNSTPTLPSPYCLRVAIHCPSARPSTFIRPLAEAPSIHPAKLAFTSPGAPIWLSFAQLPVKVNSK
jgi:hypothetical protein